MTKQALGAFELKTSGEWHCFKTVVVEGPMGAVPVTRGTHFQKHSVFAGFNDFTAHLELIAVEAPNLSPHE